MRSRSKIDRYQQLRALTPFHGLTDRQLDRVDQLMTPLSLEAGAQIMAEGEPGRQAFVIVAGHAEVRVGGRQVATLGPGDVLGEMALLDPQPRSATVTATEAMQVLVADPRSFLALLCEPAVACSVLSTEVRRLREANARGLITV